MVPLVILQRQADLFEIIAALRAPGRFSNPLDGWKQQRDQDGNDGNDDKQLDERETAARTRLPEHENASRVTRQTQGDAVIVRDRRRRIIILVGKSSHFEGVSRAGSMAAERTAVATTREFDDRELGNFRKPQQVG